MPYSFFVFDLDGVVIESWLQDFAQGDFTWLSQKIPFAKHMLLDSAELVERIVGIPPVIKQNVGAWIDKNACRIGILTDRSLFGVEKILLNESGRDWLNRLAFIQVRKSVLNKYVRRQTRPNFFISPYVKPNRKTLENLASAKWLGRPESVLIMDDNARFLRIASASPFNFGTLAMNQLPKGINVFDAALSAGLLPKK